MSGPFKMKNKSLATSAKYKTPIPYASPAKTKNTADAEELTGPTRPHAQETIVPGFMGKGTHTGVVNDAKNKQSVIKNYSTMSEKEKADAKIRNTGQTIISNMDYKGPGSTITIAQGKKKTPATYASPAKHTKEAAGFEHPHPHTEKEEKAAKTVEKIAKKDKTPTVVPSEMKEMGKAKSEVEQSLRNR